MSRPGFDRKTGRPRLSSKECWVCGELRDWHFDDDEHPFVGTIPEDNAFREWYKQNRAKHMYFLDWVRAMIGVSPMRHTPGMEKTSRVTENSGLNGIPVHSFYSTGRTPRREPSP